MYSQLRSTGCLVLPLVAGIVLLVGCQREQPTPATPAEPRASVALHVLVVNDPPLAEAITRLRGEWEERTGGELAATSIAWSELIAGQEIEADVVLFPSRYLGELSVRGWLRPVRQNVLDSESLAFNDVFPPVRQKLIRWGGATMALPLGIDPQVVEKPDGPTVIAFLAEAGRPLVASGRVGVLFDPDTMKPRIDDPEFVAALARLAQKEKPPESKATMPVLGNNDRLAAVTSSSRNAASAFKLLEWLAGPDPSTQLARIGNHVLPVRSSLASSPAWYDAAPRGSERGELSNSLSAALNQHECLLLPRIPGVDEYMAALEEVVKDATAKNVAPAEALQKAAAAWEQITDAHGQPAQREAYRKHLEIDEL